ncbi:MAG: mechanosensitive ion channel family protein [Proteobacteria bacterium]|nr:mechanosensitive ion channel family protein [Pseudomonadota bacterium]
MDFKTLGCWLDTCWHSVWAQVAAAAAILVLSLVIRRVFSTWAINLIYRFVRKREGQEGLHHILLEALSPPVSMAFIIFALRINLHILDLPKELDNFFITLLATIITFTVFWAFYRLVSHISYFFEKSKGDWTSGITPELLHFTTTITKILVATLGLMYVLEGWGINVGAFLGGLGLLTAAVGFAAKDSIANLFGSIAIFMDQTLRKGEWIKVGDIEGVVEHIGLRTTLIRQFDKSITVVTNIKLSDGPVTNYTKMTHRRIEWQVSLRYDTPSQSLENILRTFKAYLDHNVHIVTDDDDLKPTIRAHGFGDSGILLKLAFYTNQTSSQAYVEVREQCLLTFKKIVEENAAHFAFPSRSLYMEPAKSA